MKRFQKVIVLILAALIVLGLLAPGLQALAAENQDLIEVKVDGYQNYDEVQAVFAQVNAQRKANGMPALTLHPILNNYAMQRAAELQVFYSHTRPDGTEYYTVLDSVFQGGDLSENIALGEQDADAAMKCWMESDVHRSAILSPDYKSIGIGCFYTEDGTVAWVQIFSSEKWHMNDKTTGVRQADDVPVQMLATNVVAQLDHSTFSNKYCALYAYEGTTMGTGLSLLNVGALGKYIPIDETTDLSGYTYISGDPSILSVNNENRTLTAVAPGKTTLRIQHNGEDVLFHDTIASYLTYELTVEVMELPSLSYETDGRCYAIDYSGFNTSAWALTLWIKGNHDEMWMMGNIERDGIYDFYPTDMTDTYVCVMRYFDEYLDRYVEVGDRLIIQLGDEEPESPEEPTAPAEPEPTEPEETEPSAPEIFIPTAADLPHLDAEPSFAEVRQIMQELKQGYYPDGAVWPDTLTYQLNVDAQDDYLLEYSYGWIAAVSDLIFGDLPACVVSDPSLNDLRPGDILTFQDGDILVTDVAADYIEGACVGISGKIQWKNLYPISILSDAFLITRYETDAPGMDAVSIGIVPRDAVIVDQGDESCYNNQGKMLSFVRWTLTEDNTLYIYGDGPGVGIYQGAFYEPVWEAYRLQITGLVVDGCLEELDDGLFAVNYPNLREVTIHGEMEELNENLFYRCAALERVVIDGQVETIGNSAFSGCTVLNEVVLSDSLASIGQDAFYNCIALSEIRLPENLNCIGKNAFYSCTGLTQVQFPENLETIDHSAFGKTGLTAVELPAGLKTLGSGAFAENQNLTTVYIPAGITEMTGYAFANCPALTTVTLGEGITMLGDHTFSSDYALKSFTIPGSLTGIPEGLLSYCDGLETVIIESGVETIGMHAFDTLHGMKELHLPNTLKRIEQDAFRNLKGENVDVYFYGTPEQWETIEIESGNHGLELFAWKINFVDPDACRHTGTIIVPGSDPTCTANGLTDGIVCADCGEILAEQEILYAQGHQETATVTEPTCTEGGCTTYTCVLCGEGRVDNYTNPLGHDWLGQVCGRCGEVNANPFHDVAESDYFCQPVLWAVENGITTGTGNGNFSPSRTCTRAQVVTFLWRALGQPEPENTGNPFTDVAEGDWFYKAVLWARASGITSGKTAATFGPNDPCTRGQVVTFLWRALGNPAPRKQDNPFTDVASGIYYYEPVLWAVENGITSGTSKTTFAPSNPCTRGQVVTFLYRAFAK